MTKIEGRTVIGDSSALEMVWGDNRVKEAVQERVQTTALDLQMDRVKEGFGSIVVPVEGAGAVLKVPKISEHKPVHDIYDALSLAGVDQVLGMWVVGSDAFHEVDLDENGVVKGYDNGAGSLPHGGEYLFMLLEQLPEGETLLGRMIEGSVEDRDLPDIYSAAARALRELHQKPIHGIEDNDFWNVVANSQVITADERMKTIINMPQLDKEWFDKDTKRRLMRKMGVISRNQIHGETSPLRRIHGDNWEGNWWVSNQGEVLLFDNALAYGYAGHDLAFGVGKQLIRYISTGSQEALDSIVAYQSAYGKDLWKEAEGEMWNPLVFKVVVGAAFDGYDEETNAQLIKYAEALLDHKIANPEARLDLELAKGLWDEIGDK